MIRHLRSILTFAVLLAGLLPGAVQAQQGLYDGFAYGGPALHYPYVSTAPTAASARAYRRHRAAERRTAHTRRALRDKAFVIETARAAEDAPRAAREGAKGKGHVIHADAEVTIFGPDRMIIRLHRKKNRGSERSVRAD